MNPLSFLPQPLRDAAAYGAGVASVLALVSLVSPLRDFVRDWLTAREATEACIAKVELEAAKEGEKAQRLLAEQRRRKIEELQQLGALDAAALRQFETRAAEDAEQSETEQGHEAGNPDLPSLGDLRLQLRNR